MATALKQLSLGQLVSFTLQVLLDLTTGCCSPGILCLRTYPAEVSRRPGAQLRRFIWTGKLGRSVQRILL